MQALATVTAAETAPPAATALLDWAEQAFPQFFPSLQKDGLVGPYTYRYYPETGNYLGVAGTGIWILGPVAGSSSNPVYVGEVTAFRCGVAPASCDDAIELKWVTVPTQPVTPGLLADPDPATIQDGGLNSSLVLQLTRNGIPVAGEEIVWAASDGGASLQAPVARSDAQGLVRAWYLAGPRATQRLSARHAATGKTLAVTLQRVATPRPTVGRYAAAYFTAPDAAYNAVSASIVPRTAPERTFYAAVSVWHDDSQFALYAGLQVTDCVDTTSSNPAFDAACTVTGARRGRLALFSSWEWLSPTGARLLPVLVSAPAATHCQVRRTDDRFLQCQAPLPWDLDEEWRFLVEQLPGAAAGYQRVRATAFNPARSIAQVIAVVDVPGLLNLGATSVFNDNQGGLLAESCLQVAQRRVTVASVGFWNGTRWVRPDYAQGSGDVDDSTMSRCENYGFKADASGLTLASGGTDVWIRLEDALVLDDKSGLKVFPNQDQVDLQWQPLDLTTVRLPPTP